MMQKLGAFLAVIAGSGALALAAPGSALACDTSYWNAGCQLYSVGESHSAYPGATPHFISVRMSADPAKWVSGKTKQILTTGGGSWVRTTFALGYDDTWITYVDFSNSRGGCYNFGATNGSIWINCAAHLF
jgi:hypothetical protein